MVNLRRTTFAFLAMVSVISWQSMSYGAESLNDWLNRQTVESQRRMLLNISPPGAAPGAVAASLSRQEPDYYYHWIRDAALTMNVIFDLMKRSTGTEAEKYERLLNDFVDLSRRNQTTKTPSDPFGLGEPKFQMDGNAFWGPWGRPQNDGPALRAVTLIRLANHWLDAGKAGIVVDKLYRSEIPATTVIKADLEFVSHHWRMANFDLWEEEKGDHFYTRMVQRRSMIDGAKLARRLGDGGAADWYERQARELEHEIRKHYDSNRKLIIPSFNVHGGKGKYSGLDAAVVLAALHGGAEDGFFDVTSDAVLSSAAQIEGKFASFYPINSNGQRGVAIGRYPEDTYDGVGVDGQGNGWFLITNGFAELYFSAANRFERAGNVTVTPTLAALVKSREGRAISANRSVAVTSEDGRSILRSLRSHGDELLERVRYHAGRDGSLSEQMNRHTGFMQGAKDLTWSHASMLTVVFSR